MAREFARQFYNSKEWKKLRSYILMRDNYKCQHCGKSGILEVHHITHLTPDNINDPSITMNEKNLITLCRDCHFLEHSHRAAPDCEEEYIFDENGFLVPRQPR